MNWFAVGRVRILLLLPGSGFGIWEFQFRRPVSGCTCENLGSAARFSVGYVNCFFC